MEKKRKKGERKMERRREKGERKMERRREKKEEDGKKDKMSGRIASSGVAVAG